MCLIRHHKSIIEIFIRTRTRCHSGGCPFLLMQSLFQKEGDQSLATQSNAQYPRDNMTPTARSAESSIKIKPSASFDSTTQPSSCENTKAHNLQKMARELHKINIRTCSCHFTALRCNNVHAIAKQFVIIVVHHIVE